MKTYKLFGLPVFSVEERGLNPENPNTSIADWADSIADGTPGSPAVTQKTALTYSGVYACVRIISETIASLPLSILAKDGEYILKEQHPLSYFLEKQPNQAMTRFQFWETLLSHMTLTGNGYAIIHRDSSERPVRFQLIADPSRVKVLYDSDRDLLKYEITASDGEKKKIYDAFEVLHIKGLSIDGIVGLSPIEYHRKTISAGISETEFQKSFFENGAHLSGILSFPGSLDDSAYKRLKDSWNRRYSGANKTGATAILEGGADYKPIGIKPIDAQFMEQRRFTIEDIARIYRVPLHLIQDTSRSTFSNIEHQSIDFVQHTIRPIVKRIEGELDGKLFLESEKQQGRYFTRFNLDALLRGDVTSRANFYKTLYYTGALNANEIRSMEGMNPYDGGDEYRVQSNTESATDKTEDNEN